MSATQSRSGPVARKSRLTRSGKGAASSSRMRRSHEAPAVDAREVVVLHQPGDPLARHVVPGLGEVGPDPGHAIRAAAPGMGLPDLRG